MISQNGTPTLEMYKKKKDDDVFSFNDLFLGIFTNFKVTTKVM